MAENSNANTEIPKIVPKNHEVKLQSNEFIVSKTDPSGHITYVNRTFMKIVGWNEQMMVGKPHNIIRHPDMPRGAFRLLWKTLQAKQEFFGLVKNLTAEGSYYWVFANVTLDVALDGRLIGYYSVREQPNPNAVKLIEGVYQEMVRIEKQSNRQEAPDASLTWLMEQIKSYGYPGYEHFILQLNSKGAI